MLKRESISLLSDELPGVKLRMKMVVLFVGAGLQLRIIPELGKTQRKEIISHIDKPSPHFEFAPLGWE